jgi:hypothetical protein
MMKKGFTGTLAQACDEDDGEDKQHYGKPWWLVRMLQASELKGLYVLTDCDRTMTAFLVLPTGLLDDPSDTGLATREFIYSTLIASMCSIP